MFGWISTIICVGTWLLALGLWLFSRKPKIADVLLGAWVTLPLAFFTVVVNLNFMVKSPGEVFPVLIIIALVASGPLALLFGWLATECKTLEGNLRWMPVFGAVTGAAIGIIHLWIFVSQSTSIDTQAEWWMFSVTDGLIGALLFGTVAKGQARLTKKQIALHCVAPAISLLVAGYLLPEVAFRTSGYRDSYSWLEQKGAERLSKGSGSIAGTANRALARSGDKTKLALLLDDIRSGKPTLGVNGSIQILTAKYSHEPEVQEALISLLNQKASENSRPGSFGDHEWMLLELIKAAKAIRKETAVPALIRIYKNYENNLNLQTESSEALVAIGGTEASEFAQGELKREPPISPAIAKILMRRPEARDSKSSYENAIAKRDTDRRLRSAPVSQLVLNKNNDELYRRATDKDSGDRGMATIGLIKLHDPRRERVLLINAFPAHGWAKELRGFSDPVLANSISSRILKSKSLDGHLARFLCEWSPPEGRNAAQFLVEKRTYGPAVQYLMRLGDDVSVDLLAKQLANNPKGPLGIQICGTLASRPTSNVVPALLSAMAIQEERPRLLYNGKELFLADVAAIGLMRSPSIPAQTKARAHVFKGSREEAEEYIGYCGKSVER